MARTLVNVKHNFNHNGLILTFNFLLQFLNPSLGLLFLIFVHVQQLVSIRSWDVATKERLQLQQTSSKHKSLSGLHRQSAAPEPTIKQLSNMWKPGEERGVGRGAEHGWSLI